MTALGTSLAIVRMLREERYLRRTSQAYREYLRHVRWHLIPGVW